MNHALRAYTTVFRHYLVELAVKRGTSTQKRRRRRRILAARGPVDVARKALPQALEARIRRRESWVFKRIMFTIYSPRKIDVLWYAESPFAKLLKRG